VSTGTCFAVSPDGLLLTAQHVVDGFTDVRITYTDGRTTTARVIAEDEENDMALLQAATDPPDYLGLARDGQARAGDYVFTLGYPATDLLGTEPKFTDGSISSLSGLRGDPSLLQVSVPIQPGNSGGPLVTSTGDVVGVISATATSRSFELATGSLPQNVNWAVKSGHAADLLDRRPVRAAAETRRGAVERAGRSVCLVEAVYE
jgi:S1-C subfamily serine protease